MKLKLLLFCAFFSCYLPFVWAQQNTDSTAKSSLHREPLKLRDPSLKGQYGFLLYRSPANPDGTRSVSPYRLNQFWLNVSDSLAKERGEKKQLSLKLKEQERTINYLKTINKDREESIQASQDISNSINFMGISFKKSTYHYLVWGIISCLVLLLLVVAWKLGKHLKESTSKIERYEELDAEFQAFKSKTIEKERKLARELQDERNKLDDLLGRS